MEIRQSRRNQGGNRMMGYKYEDIQAFGSVLNGAEFYLPPNNTEIREGLVKIWDFFEGLLAEGYVDDPNA